jgi:hypothetical protein
MDEKEDWRAIMKEVMVLQAEYADLSRRFFDLWKRVDDKLNGEKEKTE